MQASQWAQGVLLDPEKKAYYARRAKALKLPNAYTAALTDYMRKPRLTAANSYHYTPTYEVKKQDFQLQNVEVVIAQPDNSEEARTISPTRGEWMFRLTAEEVLVAGIRVMDDVDKVYVLHLSSIDNPIGRF